MPADASIAMSVQDNLSAAIVAMKSSVTNFRSDVKYLQEELDRLNATRVQMRVDLTGAKREAQQAQKAFESLGDAATEAERQAAEADWKKAEENLENIRQQYDLVGRQVRQTTRDMEKATGAISRAENRAGGSGRMGMLSALGQAGLYDMLGEAAGQWANTLVSSGLGSDMGSLFSSALSGAGSGAAIGTMILPGIGTAVGAAAGAGIGLLTGASQVYEQRDEAFKSYVQEATQGQLDEMSESITSGSATAAQRELDAIAFNQLLGKGVGDTYLEDLRTMAADTPMEYGDLTQMSRSLATGFGDDPDRMLELLEGLGNAGSAVGTDASGMTYMAQVMSRMQSSDMFSREDMNAFQDRGINVLEMLSEALDKTQGDIYEMISKGSIGGQEAVDIIQKGLDQYAGAMDQMSQTYSGLTSTLADAQTEMDNAYGQGYNETRKQGIQAEIDYLSGESGAMIQEANRAMGAWQAELENSKEQYIRDAMDAVINSDEYKAAIESGTDEGMAEAGRMLMEAKVAGMNEYNASEGAQLVLESEMALATGIREDASSNQAYWDAGYRKSQEYSKGLAAGLLELVGTGTTSSGRSNYHNRGYDRDETPTTGRSNYHDRGYAYGLARVPYDGYAAVLHQGERVLTAREAREDDRSRTPIQITITGNSFGAGVSAEEIAQRLADALEVKLAAGRVKT
ncbi:tape measure protein [Intestinimonas massiliensis (ex Afouda et al. 2020)]|uniref:tape measure protein n=1 Tax=Intestinimonas massiliensis (ex Afouda et al. 2020) TaxID=1673721 RepID=UPI00103135F5|nr:tape measure protein [Intestinimonas massiliensis (ex Afouda et al. 2020)]